MHIIGNTTVGDVFAGIDWGGAFHQLCLLLPPRRSIRNAEAKMKNTISPMIPPNTPRHPRKDRSLVCPGRLPPRVMAAS